MSNISVAVLGAGMVGVASALALQKKGFRVTLLDRLAPGEETSYGNAGVIARSSLMPFNNPSLWGNLPVLLKNQSAGFRYQAQFLLQNLGWAARFVAQARRTAFEETTTALDSLIRLSMTEHAQLLRASGAAHRMRDNGWMFLYRQSAAFAGGALARERMAHFGVATEVLERDHIRQLEPALNPIFERALWVKDTWSVDSPGDVVKAYAELFRKQGGQYAQARIKTVEPLAGSRWRIRADGAQDGLEADRVVVALGPWSRQFMATLGVKVPMAYERGYHMHFAPPASCNISRPVYDTAGAYVLSPMEQGLRLTSGVELTDIDAPTNPVQLGLAEAAAREAIDMGQALEPAPWMGSRPTLPDSRPIIGAMPGQRNLWLAFGHQHIGFSTGPGTGAILAALMRGDDAPVDVRPFRAERFLKG
ncbi:FAD-binding oxidoreductase [Comamonas piscis]|uniref:FAD-binding oxidoreductase n=1 Tax=Comamonas piscis TaxID=1562974 RepID=A0A7G5ELE0_9BURK|nr:FAD-dependent oxidoreductase [Comamonas piscis]QMV74815.1 FAD-binding oxidoreductase [Comamonas piscis]WSO33285.1 FAD-dependent oxidoreductase [Comamonas piscis]